jgi:hypothetical protein
MMLSEISQTQKDKLSGVLSHMWSLDLKQRQEHRRGTVWHEEGDRRRGKEMGIEG